MPKTKRKSEAQKARERKEYAAQRRQNSDVREAEQQTNSQARRAARSDPQRREQEQQARRAARSDPLRREQEQRLNTQSHKRIRRDSKSSYDKLFSLYKEKINESPTFICSCCGGLFYPKSTVLVPEEKLIAENKKKNKMCSAEFISSILHVQQQQHRLCSTCKTSAFSNRVPRLALCNGFDFPVIPPELQVFKLHTRLFLKI
jgi:hypothetical protein